MKLPLLGIIAIVVLQLGYTAYNALDRPLASLYPVRRIAINTEPLAVLEDGSDSAFESYDVVRADVRPINDRDIHFSRSRQRRQFQPTAQMVVFRNTVIRVPYAKPLNPRLVAMEGSWDSAVPKQPLPMRSGGEPRSVVLSTRQSYEKRSFASRSVAVLKKPYDWIKTLGSKLN
jgi:hypothetical protein